MEHQSRRSGSCRSSLLSLSLCLHGAGAKRANCTIVSFAITLFNESTCHSLTEEPSPLLPRTCPGIIQGFVVPLNSRRSWIRRYNANFRLIVFRSGKFELRTCRVANLSTSRNVLCSQRNGGSQFEIRMNCGILLRYITPGVLFKQLNLQCT